MSSKPPLGDNPFTDQPGDFGSPRGETPPWQDRGDATGGIIPYKNPPALIGYYLGVFSAIPCLGLLLAVPAVVLGIVGLRSYARNPLVKGRVHAWVAILAGSVFGLLWVALIVLLIVASNTR